MVGVSTVCHFLLEQPHFLGSSVGSYRKARWNWLWVSENDHFRKNCYFFKIFNWI